MLQRSHALLLLPLYGCGPLPTESAYSQQRDICGEDSELFAPRLEDCRARFQADRSCAGVIGFSGNIEGVEVIVESDLTIARLGQVETLAGPIVRNSVELIGRSPYFEYSLVVKDLGGGIDDPSAPPRTLSIGTAAGVWDDDLFSAGLRLSTGAESDDLNSVAGTLVSTLQIVDEQAGQFELELESGDVVAGCFHAIATESTLVQESESAP